MAAVLDEFRRLGVRPPTHKKRDLTSDPMGLLRGGRGPEMSLLDAGNSGQQNPRLPPDPMGLLQGGRGAGSQFPHFAGCRADSVRILDDAFGAPSADPKT